MAYDNFQFILLEEINCTLKINKLAIIIAPCPQMVIITAPIKGFLPKIKGGNCHIPISQKTISEDLTNYLKKAQYNLVEILAFFITSYGV